ncbi:MAG: hypothetical protein Gyms2KO_03290 [Gymnodinialimonas sp.]
MPHTLREREILAGARNRILRIMGRRRWSVEYLADATKLKTEKLYQLLKAPYADVEANYEVLNRLLRFGHSRLRPWDPATMRLLRMARDFREFYR